VSTNVIYGGRDPADLPAYTLREAAQLVGISASTLRAWTRSGSGLIVGAAPSFLSFTNVVEAHVLVGLRRHHGVRVERIRAALRYVSERLGVAHPLARERFRTDGADLFVDGLSRERSRTSGMALARERPAELVNASLGGQLAIRDVLEAQLRRVEYEHDRAIRLFPLHREGAPRFVVVDPRLAFGRPVLVGTAVPIQDIAARFHGGEDVKALAADYDVDPARIEEALRAS
jgi:uncharacterized protein (DUF433 family)